MVGTKIDMNCSKISRIEYLDELASILYPGNKNHQKIFLAIFIELKWSENQFLTALEPIADKYGFSRRVLEIVRAKMRRMGMIDHVSRFNHKHGYKEGWVFSSKFSKAINRLTDLMARFKEQKNGSQERRDRDLLDYT
jgi:hypothetical protein